MDPRNEPRIRIGPLNWLWVLANVAAVGAHFAYCAYTWFLLPDRYPIHFGPGGVPDRWADGNSLEWFLLPVIAAAMALFMTGLGVLLPRIPFRLWNVPGKKKLMHLPASRRVPIVRSTVGMVLVISLLDTAMMLWIQVMIFRSAHTGTADILPEILAIMALYTGVIVAWIIRLTLLSLRLSREAPPPSTR